MTDSGVQADEELAAALLPVLLHRINNTTQLLFGVRAMVEGSGPMPERCAGDLAAAAEEAHQLGWLLGLLAGGLGSDLLLARHESNGLEPMLRLVRDGLRRRERMLEFRAGSIPLLTAKANSAMVCWTVAMVVWAAAQGCAKERVLALEFERNGGRWFVRGDAGARKEWLAFAEAACARLPGAECSRDGEAWNCVLPGPWLEPSAR